MTEFISRDAAICIADYAVDEHPYDKNPEQPETYSDYNQGWNDACDYIRARLENDEKADVEPVRYGRWEWFGPNSLAPGCMCGTCSACKVRSKYITNRDVCPNCGARMDLGGAENG